MASIASSLTLPPNFAFNSKYRQRSRFQIRSLGGEDSAVLSQTPVRVNGVSLVAKEEETFGGLIDRVNGELVSIVEENNNKANNNKKKKNGENVVLRKLEPLWDDGYGTYTVKDYLDLAKDVIKPDGGPPRWFCPVPSGPPLEDSPVLLFLPGMDGLGFGLILHQKALGKVFEVRCLHIPVQDRTPFRDLVKLVEQTVRTEHASSPNKPIYIVGDSLGGCLALAVAARVPTIDLVIILANPATSFGSSQLQPFFPLLEAMPNELHSAVPYLLSCVMGNPLKMATVSIETTLPPEIVLNQLSGNLTALLPRLSTLAEIIPKDTLLWKLKLLGVASAYANSRLHAVTAEVLVLASGQDNMLPSRDEAQRLSTSLKNCKIYNFNGNGHTILLEDGVNLLTIIKGTCKYRRSKKLDFVKDFIPPSMSEYKLALEENRLFRVATSPVMFSTMEDGTVIRGLAGVPNEGPVLLVGYHMLLGLELPPLVLEFLREKNLMIRGLAHPTIFSTATESKSRELSIVESLKVFGAVPVTPTNLFNLLAAKSHALLYPGGAREALHRKGEEYTLFWPEEQEFVRMAVKFGATVVPFGAVGEDDIVDLVLDYDDIMAIPLVNDFIRKHNEQNIRLRADKSGEVANQDFYPPGLLPKIPGRFYYMFGKPIETKGKEEVMKNKASAKELYLKIKSEVENCMGYLIKKRGEDPYRNIVDRTLYSVVSTPIDQIPTFKP